MNQLFLFKNLNLALNLNYLQIKIHITFINDILLDADVAEGDGGIGMVENLLQEFYIIKLFIVMIAEGFAPRMCSDFVLKIQCLCSLIQNPVSLITVKSVTLLGNK